MSIGASPASARAAAGAGARLADGFRRYDIDDDAGAQGWGCACLDHVAEALGDPRCDLGRRQEYERVIDDADRLEGLQPETKRPVANGLTQRLANL
jgi:hypothetical protein